MAMAARIAMIATTIISSIRVKPRWFFMVAPWLDGMLSRAVRSPQISCQTRRARPFRPPQKERLLCGGPPGVTLAAGAQRRAVGRYCAATVVAATLQFHDSEPPLSIGENTRCLPWILVL